MSRLDRLLVYTGAIAAGVLVGVLFWYSLRFNLQPLLTGMISGMFFLIGLGTFVGTPFVFSQGSPGPVRHRVFRFYNWLAQKALVRSLLVKRDHAGVDLCASDYNAEKGSERVKLDGEWRDFEDIADRMYYMNGPFGIVLEGLTCVIDPVDAAIGSRRRRVVEDGEEVMDFRSVLGEEQGEAVREHVTLPEDAPVVDLSDAEYLIGGSGEPSQAEATEEFEKKAWAEYQGVPVVDVMVMAGLFSAILFVIWLAFSFAASSSTGGGGGGIDIVSGFIAPMMWWFM